MIGANTERNFNDTVKVRQPIGDELRRSLNHGINIIRPRVEFTLRNRNIDFRSRITDDELGLFDVEQPGKEWAAM